MYGRSASDVSRIGQSQDGRAVRTIHTPAVFSFIGAMPRTDWLPDEIERDEKGFVRTGLALGKPPRWTAKRPPFLLETSQAGRVRRGRRALRLGETGCVGGWRRGDGGAVRPRVPEGVLTGITSLSSTKRIVSFPRASCANGLTGLASPRPLRNAAASRVLTYPPPRIRWTALSTSSPEPRTGFLKDDHRKSIRKESRFRDRFVELIYDGWLD